MKLRSLIALTEQAPQPPPMGGAPVAAPVAPPSAGAEEPPTPEAPSPDTAPSPEDPAEYDWTRDFREFEDAKNKAESEGKKKLLDAMNKKLLNKTIVANASRGYGQPKTDYTIENIKKISVEFWYKDYVVIVSDANDKKYFLTPGINIKIEGGEAPEGGAQGEPPAEEPQIPGQGAPVPGQEEPNTGTPQPTTDAPPAPEGQPPAPTSEPPPVPPAPQAKPQAPVQPPAQQPPEEQPSAPPLKKRKKMAEWMVQRDLSSFLKEFMSESSKDKKGNVNFIPYIKKTTEIVTESTDCSKQKFLLEIPVNHMVSPLDIREVKLSAVDVMRRVTRFGQYSKGSVEINKLGRLYLVEYVKEVGWIS